MFNFLGRALGGLVLTKSARDAVGKARVATAAKAAHGGKAATIAAMQAQAKGLVTPERAVALHNAMKVRAAKQTILENLSDEQRAKLVGIAMKRLLNEDKK
jgi:hypothetical protein